MVRPITLCTSQWIDLPLEVLAQKAQAWGFDGLELSCGGDHFEVDKALESDAYIHRLHEMLARYHLSAYAISNHLVGQCVCDPIDERHRNILPARLWRDGDPEGVRQRCAEEMKRTAQAARAFGVDTVNGFTGSSIWADFYFFPPTGPEKIEAGYCDFTARWLPILEAFRENEVRFALEVHPTEIAYDIYTMKHALAAVNNHPNFGINFDPSHLMHQFINPVSFLDEFSKRIFHVHVKDIKLRLDGRSSILGSHLAFGDARRGWDFVSPGHGDIRWDELIRKLNQIGYAGPLSIEWEDSGMEREWGAQDALAFVKKLNFSPSTRAFDAAFSTNSET
jgi:sugar phosphate isomerase/epimerase